MPSEFKPDRDSANRRPYRASGKAIRAEAAKRRPQAAPGRPNGRTLAGRPLPDSGRDLARLATLDDVELRALPRRGVRLFRRRYQYAKRALDLCVSAVILLPILIVMAACAIFIWLEDGRPIMFVQLRTGRCGRRFKIYKFRTMVKNAEELKQKLWHMNKMSGPEFKLADDPRVTRVGRFLRKWSLDELPQIINVLKGDMSLVGPRPTSFDATKYALWQTERLEVLPGVTGLAQVSGRSELSFEEKLRFDMRYVERRSFWLDLQILMRTAGVLLNSRGAF